MKISTGPRRRGREVETERKGDRGQRERMRGKERKRRKLGGGWRKGGRDAFSLP